MPEKLTGTVIGVPLELMMHPREGEAMVNRWWVVHDGYALWYRSRGMRGWTPQCNRDVHVARRVTVDLWPGAEPLFVGVAYVGRWDENYGYMLSKDLLDASKEFDDA